MLCSGDVTTESVGQTPHANTSNSFHEKKTIMRTFDTGRMDVQSIMIIQSIAFHILIYIQFHKYIQYMDIVK